MSYFLASRAFQARHAFTLPQRPSQGALWSTTRISTRTFASTCPLRLDPHADTPVTDRFSMKGKTTMITGGGRGIGFAITKAIAQLGGNVAVLDVLPKPLDEFEELSSKYGIKAHYERTDVTEQSGFEASFDRLLQQTGGIQGLVTAAGIVVDKPFTEHQWEESKRVLNVNVMGTFWAARLAAKHMSTSGKGGSIVLIASITAQGIKIPMQNVSVYNMSKAAVKGLVGPLAVELGEHGIRVNSISPGVISTPMTEGLRETNPVVVDMFDNATPVGRIGQPSDLTPAVAWLLSEASGFTTGSDVVITGGLHAGIAPKWLRRAV